MFMAQSHNLLNLYIEVFNENLKKKKEKTSTEVHSICLVEKRMNYTKNTTVWPIISGTIKNSGFLDQKNII